ncbi:RNA methyltransferase ['Fragaria x ananassa' phyllody phytoplasma]|uniref:RNA methyltransferase n=1 Tax='Fragaria x ananassa' phyllody phytoplasma TaxID=2358428 RepID=A0ABS5K3F0_9MOLU|nr:RNA methyltransferase ['Fragaria x ananassa' phyllody phytoplasma]MBS2126408.1 RNA methyltransferase ['Fragaria x ananassa' phyllody phytoplasma]
MITSKQNPIFKKLKKLKLKKYRDLYQQFLIYGDHLIEQAEQAQNNNKNNFFIEIYTSSYTKKGIFIAPELMKELSQTKTVFDQIALCQFTLSPKLDLIHNKILVLEDIQDPANLGALMRSAVAFGFNQIFLSFHSADFYHEKTIRTSQGSLFNLVLQRGQIKIFLEQAKQKGYQVFITLPHQKANISFEKTKSYLKKILILGNEGSGISFPVITLADYCLNIKTQQVESLNVAVAGSILMYLL